MDIATPTGTSITIPVLIAANQHHLPTGCQLLLGAAQINTLNISVDEHRKAQRQPLIFAGQPEPTCYIGEKQLAQWWEANKEKPVGHIPYTHDDVDINPDLFPQEITKIKRINEKYASVFNAAKGALPPLADGPPIELKLKPNWKHVTDVKGLRNLVAELGMCQQSPTIIYQDNESAIKIANNRGSLGSRLEPWTLIP